MFRIITTVFLLFPILSFSQWNNAGNNYTTGRLGIGTSNPGFQLEIIKSSSPYFQVFRDASPGNDSYCYNMMSSSYHIFGSNKNGTGVLRKIGFAIGGSDNEADIKMMIDVNGFVGIGTKTPDARLTVSGDIHSREVKVTVNAGADYVFNDDYEPISLTELEKFIRDKRHLPEMQSAKEMEEEGLELGKMDIRLLKKIEELTLYMIIFNKEMESLKAENEELKRRLIELEK